MRPEQRLARLKPLVALAFALSGCGALATTPSEPQSRADLNFELATSVVQSSSSAVANGFPVQAGDWPSLIIATYTLAPPLQMRSFTCTAVLVGPNVALMAAHCVDPKRRGPAFALLKANLKVGGRWIPYRCEIHPDYLKQPLKGLSPRGSQDFALCILLDAGELPEVLKTMRFEVVEAQEPLKQGAAVLMTGYGCERLSIVDGLLQANRADGVLRLGDARIHTAPPGVAGQLAYATIHSQVDVQPALCPGDSGGPLLSGATARDADQQRRVRGVNSSVGVQGQTLVSSIAATGTPTFREWAQDWIKRNQAEKAQVCGLNVPAGHRQCRN